MKFQTLSILAWALSEAVAVFGLTLLFVGGTLEQGLALITASVVLGLLQKPNFDRIKEII